MNTKRPKLDREYCEEEIERWSQHIADSRAQRMMSLSL